VVRSGVFLGGLSFSTFADQSTDVATRGYTAKERLTTNALTEKDRAGGIRTHDLLNPIQAHYQAVLRPDDKESQDAAPKRRFQARKASIREETIR
jgi:hypothetical protein